MNKRVYVSRSLKCRKRRSRADVAELLSAIQTIIDGEEYPITVRHLFYRLVSLRIIPKTENAYHALVRHLSRWRRSGEVPWEAFADSTRWHIRNQTFNGTTDALQRCKETYRRDMWATQPHYVELWLEKDAIASIVVDVADQFGVPIFVCRGFASLSSLHGAAQTFRGAKFTGKRVTILHLGDYDPSGHAAANAIEDTLTEDFGCNIDFERLAILPGQIDRLHLPTRPTKQSDSRAKNWDGDECVELDAMPPAEMCALVEDAITDLIDPFEWEQMQKIETEERESLQKICAVL
jgi:hypothetical protein